MPQICHLYILIQTAILSVGVPVILMGLWWNRRPAFTPKSSIAATRYQVHYLRQEQRHLLHITILTVLNIFVTNARYAKGATCHAGIESTTVILSLGAIYIWFKLWFLARGIVLSLDLIYSLLRPFNDDSESDTDSDVTC